MEWIGPTTSPVKVKVSVDVEARRRGAHVGGTTLTPDYSFCHDQRPILGQDWAAAGSIGLVNSAAHAVVPTGAHSELRVREPDLAPDMWWLRTIPLVARRRPHDFRTSLRPPNARPRRTHGAPTDIHHLVRPRSELVMLHGAQTSFLFAAPGHEPQAAPPR